MSEEKKKVPKRIARTVLNSLKGGVVPHTGLPYITVGRKNEIAALLHDVDIIADGGASFRFLVGKYGSGKSFLIQTIRNYIMDRGFIVCDADLSPERRLHGTKGQGLVTYRELIGNLATKTRPEGGALSLVLDRWINAVQMETLRKTGLSPKDPVLAESVDREIDRIVSQVSELVHGFEFVKLLVLIEEKQYPYLMPRGTSRLHDARETFRKAGMDKSPLIHLSSGWTYVGAFSLAGKLCFSGTGALPETPLSKTSWASGTDLCQTLLYSIYNEEYP